MITAAIAPARYWPWPPMLKSPQRNANPTAIPVISVHAALRPGGRLALVEIHPLFVMVASLDPLVLDFPYAFDGGRVFDEPGSYADPDADVAATKTIEYAHSIGEVS